MQGMSSASISGLVKPAKVSGKRPDNSKFISCDETFGTGQQLHE